MALYRDSSALLMEAPPPVSIASHGCHLSIDRSVSLKQPFTPPVERRTLLTHRFLFAHQPHLNVLAMLLTDQHAAVRAALACFMRTPLHPALH